MRRIRYTCWAVCFMVLCLAAAVQASETEPVAVPSPEAGWSGPFRLGAGDVLNVFIWKHKELSTMVTVRPDGKINYPLIGEIEAKGLTLGEIEERINKQLKQHIQDPQALAMARGLTTFASRNKIFIVNPARGNEQRIPFSYSKFVQGEDTNQNVMLRPGDTVIVP